MTKVVKSAPGRGLDERALTRRIAFARLPQAQKCILFAFRDISGGRAVCRTTLDELSRATGYCTRTMGVHIQWLAHLGILERRLMPSGPTAYRIHPEAIPQLGGAR